MGRIKKQKRLPWSRKYGKFKRPNLPNCEDVRGSRVFVKGTVNQVKRELREAGLTFKKVRLSGFSGVVEVIYTQWNRETPYSYYLLKKPCRVAFRMGRCR